MSIGINTKQCQNCGRTYHKNPKEDRSQWTARQSCSRSCAGELRRGKTKERRPVKICKSCGKQFRSANKKYCSTDCFLKERKRKPRNCLVCGMSFHPTTEARKYCSTKCARIAPRPKGQLNPCWKGRSVTQGGYVLLRLNDDSQFASMRTQVGYVLEHRLVMAKSLKRVLSKREEVHHLNGKRHDNRIENLQLRVWKHGAGASFQCCDCGSMNVKPIPI